MRIAEIYKELEGKTISFPKGWAHPTIVHDVGNSTPVEVVVEDGYAKYKGEPIKLSAKGWHFIYLTYKGVL